MLIPRRFFYLILFGLLACAPLYAADLPGTKTKTNIGGDFTLHSLKGDVSLKALRGKVVLVYFGYINCPDACPTTLTQWRKAFKLLSKPEQKNVQGIFVSVDPERDSLRELSAFTDFFSPRIIGVTGTPAELQKVTALYGTKFQILPHKPGKNYGVEHSYKVFVINVYGKVTAVTDFTLPSPQLAALIRKALH